MDKTLILSALLILAGAALAGCADDGAEQSTADPNADCEDRNLVDDDVVADEDGSTLGQCEEYERA